MSVCPFTLDNVKKRATNYKSVDFRGCTFFANENFSDKGYDACLFDGVNLANSNFTKTKFKLCQFSNANMKNSNFTKSNFTGANLKGVNASNAVFLKADFTGSHLGDADFTGANFTEAKLDKIDLTDVKLTRAIFKKAKLVQAIMPRVDLRGANLILADFEVADLNNAVLAGCDASGANLAGINLTGADLTSSRLNNTLFIEAKLIRANLRMADFSKSNLVNTDFTEADLTGTDFSKANLSYSKLSQAIFNKTIFENSILVGASLKMAKLIGVNLKGANLVDVDLTGADLTGADLTGANLRGTNFSRTILNNTIFTNAILYRARFTGAVGNIPELPGIEPPPPPPPIRPVQQKPTQLLIQKISPITPHEITEQDIKPIKNTYSDSVFDISLAMEIPTTEIDNDEDNVIFYIDKQRTGILYPREELRHAYDERSSFYIACDSNSYSAVPISMVKHDNLYFRLNLVTTIFIHIEDMILLLSSKHKEWFVQQTSKSESHTANLLYVYEQAAQNNIFGLPMDIVSGDHCQYGTKRNISSLTPIKFIVSSPPNVSTSVRPSPLINNKKRCPKGTQKNKRTGNCEKKGNASPQIRNVIVINDTPEVQILPNVAAVQPKNKRCPKGTRKNKAGNCVPK